MAENEREEVGPFATSGEARHGYIEPKGANEKRDVAAFGGRQRPGEPPENQQPG